VEFWQMVLQNEGISFNSKEPEWLDYPAMMQIPVSSPAVLGRQRIFANLAISCSLLSFVMVTSI
jgi:hypothetical protein